MKRFEAYFEGKWHAWVANENLSISKKNGKVVITQRVTTEGQDFSLRTEFNLGNLPMYSYA